MKTQLFGAEISEIAAHVATIDALVAIFNERIQYLEALKARAVIVQREMQGFCDMLDANEAAMKSEALDAAGTHPPPPMAN